jgi:predicted nicotinamide N-methyase
MQNTKIQQNLSATVSSAQIARTPLPLVPEISLYLISEDYPRGRLPEDEMLAILNAPAYWAFCWASGQVLARYLLDHPDLVSHRSVVDFGCGSGVVGIAAAMAGASRVIACDIDPQALDATVANADLNGVTLELTDDVTGINGIHDLAIAADVLYDRENMPWLEKLRSLARDVLIADSRIKDLEVHGYDVLDRVTATTVPDLDEAKEFSDVRVYRAHRPGHE